MPTLSDVDIKKYLDKGELCISPLFKGRIQPASVDLTLGKGFLSINSNQIIKSQEKVEYHSFDTCEFILPVGGFILATTLEWLELGNSIVGELSGKSSWGRRGLKIENAGFVDPGFKGNLTLEILNEGSAPVMLKSGEPICQIEFRTLLTSCEQAYKGKYVRQKGVTGARKDGCV